jgi:hypothetical protein
VTPNCSLANFDIDRKIGKGQVSIL